MISYCKLFIYVGKSNRKLIWIILSFDTSAK